MSKEDDMDLDEIKFDAHGLIPAIAQDAKSGEVLMLAYMSRESIEKTLETGRVYYYSRSRKELWRKGDTSGNIQELKGFYYDCDMDALLLKIDQTGVACHTGERSCFYRRLDLDGVSAEEQDSVGPAILQRLAGVIEERAGKDPESSYVARLLTEGLPLINEKVMEEAGELTEAATDKDAKEIVHEAADLLFHSMVLLKSQGVDISDVFGELQRRFGTSGIEEKNSRGKKG
jgi:phosphoribosyl-ATP pyrophosphohydrolase/phosphoribosyl-AMP cyclohydrolase